MSLRRNNGRTPRIARIYLSIEQLHAEWSTAQAADPKEKQVFIEYIGKHGEYTKIIQDAAIILEFTDDILNQFANTEDARLSAIGLSLRIVYYFRTSADESDNELRWRISSEQIGVANLRW